MGDTIGRYDLEWIEGPRYVEDIERVPGTRWLVGSAVSAMSTPGVPVDPSPGRLYLVDTEDGRVVEGWPGNGGVSPSGNVELTDPVEPERFAPHGIAISEAAKDGVRELYVVHHGARESIEVFEISVDGSGPPTLTWTGAIQRRPDIEGNAVAALPGGGLIASHYVPGLTFRPELHDGRVNGGVDRWTVSEGWVTLPGLEVAFPNGVAVSSDGGTYFLADTSGGLRRATADGAESSYVRVPLSPDNLKWGDDGRLVTTGVRQSADVASTFKAVTADPPDPLDVVVAAIDPITLEVEILVDEEVSFGLPTTVLEEGGDLYLTSLFVSRLARLRPARER